MPASAQDWLWPAVLVAAGLVAGFVNTLAGGGSILTLPLLMLAGLPPHVANGTNRVAVFLQSLAGTTDFNRHGLVHRGAVVGLLVPTLLGALLGAVTAAYLPGELLEPVLLLAMAGVAITLLVRPEILAPRPGGAPRDVRDAPLALPALFAIGFYGGFAQAGVGLLLLSVLGGLLRYDLVRANALKLLVITAFTGLALVVFVVAGQVWWVPGLALSVGMVAGSRLGVRFALQAGHETLRRIVLVGALLSCAAAWFR